MKNTMEKIIRNTILSLALSLAVFIGFGIGANAYTTTTGKVKADNVKVRESASTTSSQVSSVSQGATVDIVDEEKDDSGYVWYKIKVKNDEYGYIRSDLVEKSGGSSGDSSDNSGSSSEVKAVDQKTVEVLADSGTIRQGAGTNKDAVGKVKKGDTVTIVGETKGSDGKKWYEVTFGENNSKGFIRSDLVADSEVASQSVKSEQTDAPSDNSSPDVVAELAESDELLNEDSEEESEADTEAEAGAEPIAPDEVGDGKYSLTYESENGAWFLNVIEKKQRVDVDQLLQVADSSKGYYENAQTFKKIAIAVGTLAVVLVIIIVILIFRLRDAAYYDDEEDEDDEDDEDEEFDRYSSPKKRSRDNARNRDVSRSEVETDDDMGVNLKKRRRSRDEDEEEPQSRRAAARRAPEDAPERPARRTVTPEDRAARPARPERPMRRRPDDSFEERPSRGAEERTVRPSRRDDDSLYEDSRYEERQPSDRRMRTEETAKDEAPSRRAKNFLGDDDDFEFEFLDLDDDDR